MDILNSPVAVVIFIFTLGISLYALYGNQRLYYTWIMSPYQVVNNKKYLQLLTSGFLHADVMHLIFNMLTFYFFAFKLESIIGSIMFLITYLFSLILGNLFTVLKKKNDYNYASVGASGAISGVLFSYILFFPASTLMIFPIPFPIPSWLFGLLYLAWTYYASRHSYDMINHYAHLFGAIGGIIVTIVSNPLVIANFIGQLF